MLACLGCGCGDRFSATDLVDTAPAPDWYAIQYAKAPGCGLYVQYFDKYGTEVTDDDKRLAFFPGGAAPTIMPDQCRQRCSKWEGLGIVDIVRRSLEGEATVTYVTGTCYLKGERLVAPKLLWPAASD